MTRVKICCISSIEEARLAARLGASALGLVSEMPSGPGVIPEALIAEIAAAVPSSVDTFLLTSRTDSEGIIAQQHRCRVSTIQLCDRVSHLVHVDLRRTLPDITLVQVIHVIGEESVVEALQVANQVDMLLLDSGNPSLSVKELGGTGRTHNWSLSARIVEESSAPVFLAGGLNSANVGEAINVVRPFGVDLCSGVRTAGVLDEGRLHAFMRAVEAAS